MILIQLVGQTASSGTPAASGDLVRAYFWRRDGVPAARGVAAVAFERIYSFALLAAVGFALVLAYVVGARGAVAGIVVIALAAAGPWIMARFPEGTARSWLHRAATLPVVGRVAKPLDQAFAAIRSLIGGGGFLARFSVLTLVLFVINGGQLWLLLLGLGSTIPVWTAIGIFAISQTGGTLSTLPFGLGTMEVVMAGFLVRSGMTISQAAPAALLLRATSTLPLALAALAAYPFLERQAKAEAEIEPAIRRGAEIA